MTVVEDSTQVAETSAFASSRKFFSVLLPVLFVLSLGLASLLPIYTDEIAWPAILGRLNYDHGRSMNANLNPECMGTLTAVAEPVLRIPRWIDTYVYQWQATPATLRIWGVFLLLVWVALTWRLAIPLVPRSLRSTVAPTIMAWSALGIMPFLLVMNRPEKPLLIGTTVFLLLGMRERPGSRSMLADIGCATAILAGSWYLMAAHPRGALLLPLMGAFAFRQLLRPWLRGVCIAALVLLDGMIAHAWKALAGCEGDHRFVEELMLSNWGFAHSIHREGAFLHAFLVSLTKPAGWYLNDLFKPEFTSHMVPGFQVPHLHTLLSAPTRLLFVMALFAGAAFTIAVIRDFSRRRTHASLVVLLLAAWSVYLMDVLARVVKADYEFTYMEPFLGMLGFLSVWVWWKQRASRGVAVPLAISRALAIFQIAIFVIAAVSQLVLLPYYGSIARAQWLSGAAIASQPLSVNAFGQRQRNEEILAVAAQCGIRPGEPLQHLVIDEATYASFRNSVEPVFDIYINGIETAHYRPDPTSMLKAIDSSGMIVQCKHLPVPYRGQVVGQGGGYCCLPAFSGK